MSVSSLGNINFINQNSPVVSHSASMQQARFDMQAAMASEISAQKEREIEEVRPAEEVYRIDPEHEHEKDGSSNQDMADDQTKEQENSDEQTAQTLESENIKLYHLDIKI